METREALLHQLNETARQIADLFQKMADPEMTIYKDWTAKDILGHITFWHESLARNVSDLVKGVKPTPLKGRYKELNQRCLDEMRKHSVTEIMGRFNDAHNVIQAHILDPKLLLIPYKKGAREYTPEEHLQIVNEHIEQHLRDLRNQVG